MAIKKKSDCYRKGGGNCAVKAKGRRAAKRAPSATVQAKKIGVSVTAIKELRTTLPKGSWLTTIEGRGTTRAMSRIVLLLTNKHGEIWDASFYIGSRLGFSLDRDNGGIKQGGYGLSRSHQVVYDVAAMVWGDGYALKQNRL